jgi:type VI secretion system protein ImpC
MCAKEQAEAQAAAQTTEAESGLLDTILKQGFRARDDDSKQRAKDLLKEFVEQLLDPSMTVQKDTEKTILARIAEIDHMLSEQLNEIMHHEDFQRLEA